MFQTSFRHGYRPEARELCKLQFEAPWLVRFAQWLVQDGCHWLFGHTQHCSLQDAKSLVPLFSCHARGGSQVIHMLHEKHCSSWKSGVKKPLCSWSFPSLLWRLTAQLALVLSSLNTLSTLPVWLPAHIWAMGKGQGTNSRSPNSHPPSCLSQSGMPRTFPSSCSLSHRTSKPFAAATSVPFLSLRLRRGQVLLGI